MANELVVVARNAIEMQVAQTQLVAWADEKMTEERAQLDLVQENLDIAIKNKWRTKGLKQIVTKAWQRVQYYEKVKAALEAGYVIVPNFDLDIFAIRTTKTDPSGRVKTGHWHPPTPDRHEQATNRPALGEGEYKDPWPATDTDTVRTKDKKGEEVVKYQSWPVDFQDVDFPFKMAKPQILDDTAKAMALKIFDRIGVTPHRTKRRRDPMVIGEIVYKGGGYSERVMSFLITWWVDTSDL